MEKALGQSRQELLNEIDRRVEDGIIEKSNADLIKKLIINAESLTEAIAIAELGTTYKKTGFHFDKRLEAVGDTIKYFKKNEKLSFYDETDEAVNKLIIGDNYDALLNLLIQYRGKIDVIYIDPPYSKNSMGEFAKTNYRNALTRDNLLSMLYSRLTLAKDLLSLEGFIFCSIDDKNYAYVKCLFDDIFDESNFINTFVWKKNSSGKTEKDKFTVNTEYILFYSKSKAYTLNSVYKPLSQASLDLYKYDDNDGRGKYQSVSLQKPSSPGPETTYDYVDNTGKVWPCPPKGWRKIQSKVKELENDNRLILTGERPRVKEYWNERPNEGKRVDTLWNDLPENTTGSMQLEDIIGERNFDNPKPVELIERCINISDSNAVVLDFFAGSGTTGQAVRNLNAKDGGNRTFILCTLNEITPKTPNGIAVDVTSKRLKRTMTGRCYDGTDNFKWIANHSPLGGSLEVYEIGTIPSFSSIPGSTPFDLIDETLYGKEKFASLREKIEWICQNFEITQRTVESDEEFKKRLEEEG
ncbi:MAG: site-specific DNA-methyltransferase [Clostridium sp.]|nr:site-specific DNA-methyltransferase [Clostridium sp.]